MSGALSVRIDATQHYPIASAIRGSVTCRDIYQTATATNVSLDPYSGAITCNPVQYNSDWIDDTRVSRYPLDEWTGYTDAWEGSTTDSGIPQYLHRLWDIGQSMLDNRIVTARTFERNCGFLFQAQLCGNPGDRVDAFTIEFGQWKWKLNTSGKCYLYNSDMDAVNPVSVDIYTGRPLAGEYIEVCITPSSNGCLTIRPHRYTGRGITFKLPTEHMYVAPTPDPGEIPSVIKPNAFAIETHAIALKRVQVTELTYDETIDYTLYSIPMYLPYVPLPEQTLTVDHDDAEVFGGGVAAGLWEATVDTPFSPDGHKYIYRAIFQLTPVATAAPLIRGLHFTFIAAIPPAMGTPADVTSDVRELTITTGETASATECQFVIRNPDTYNLFGLFNRAVQVLIDEDTLFLGILKESPKYVYSNDGDQYYSVTAGGLYRQLEALSTNQDFVMDNQIHSDMVRVLCEIGGINSANLDIGSSTERLPDTRKTNAQGVDMNDDDSQFHCLPMDSSAKWIETICEKTGWRFEDGHLGSEYVLRYLDPLARDVTPVTTFVYYTSQSVGGILPRIFSISASSKPPECNELHVIGCNAAGQLMDACYLDLVSQDGTLAPDQRPTNWMGGRVTAAISIEGTTTPAWLQAVALRVGLDVCSRIDVLEVEGDWPDGLWTGDTVTVFGTIGEDYRITQLSIKFIQEIPGNIIRQASYVMERVRV